MAEGPIDFGALQYQPDLMKDIFAGIQQGASLRNAYEQRQAEQAYKTDLQSYMQAPTAQAASAFALKYPKQGEAIQKNWATLNADQQQNELKDLGIVASALESNRPDLAANTISSRIQAQKAAGMDTRPLETLAQLITTDPKQAQGVLLHYTARLPGGDKVLSSLSTLGTERRAEAKSPAEIEKAKADAIKARADAGIRSVEAEAAPTTVAQGIARTEQEIQKSKDDTRIADLNTQISQANSETQRGQLILERDKLLAEQGLKAQDKASGAQDQMDNLQAGLDTITRIRENPAVKGFFTGTGTVLGKLSGLIPGTDRKDLEGLVDTLKSQQFLAGVKQLQGMGALSNAEGEKIGSAVASLNLDQSPKAFQNALGVIETTLRRGQAKNVGSGKLSTTSPTFVATVPGVGNVTDGMVNKLLQQYPNATRDQVMQFLASQKGARAGATGGF